ncbi:MAG: glycerate kinase, partial [Clostridia bacterium]|nr:glycerate kinase [Clostridia bacterium]
MKTLNVAAALDSFKGSLSSREAGEAVRRGVLSRIPEANVALYPVGDGGEGTADALFDAFHTERRTITVSDPNGDPVEAEFGLITRDGVLTAVFDMASCSGLRHAKRHGLAYAETTTRGVGEMIRHALCLGRGEIVVGLGGSGTGDGGIGELASLGARFADEEGHTITDPRTKDLGRVAAADFSGIALPCSVRLTLLCDTNVPLTGVSGAVRMYARQK